MYATCLICNQRLGRNQSIDAFPVGRHRVGRGARPAPGGLPRLAFDRLRGR